MKRPVDSLTNRSGFEYHILAAAMAAALVIKGGGKWFLDRVLVKQEN